MPECYNKFIPIFIVKKIDCLCLCNKLRRKRAIDGGRKVTGRKVTGRKVTGRKMIRKNGQYEIFQAAL